MANNITKTSLLEESELEEIVVAYFFDGLLKSDFKNEFQKIAPEIYADLESAFLNPNCSCITKIKLFVKNNKEQFAEFLLKFVEQYSSAEDLQDKLINRAKNSKQIYLGGSVLKTSVSSWKEFFNKINGASYRSFSVVKENDDLYVFFL